MRSASSTRFVISRRGIRCPPCTLACTQSSSARTSSGRSSRPSGRMSHSIPRRTRNGASDSFAAAISSAWRRTSSGAESPDGAHRGRVVADRDVLVASRLGGAAHLHDARPSVRPSRVGVQVAADVVRLDEGRRLAAERLLAQLRWTPREVERPVDGLLVGRLRQRLERRDVRRRAGRAHEGGPEPLRLRDDELDRHALDRDAHRPPLALFDHRDDLRQRGEARQHGEPDPAQRRPPPAPRRSRATAARRRPPRRRGRPPRPRRAPRRGRG